MSKSFGHFRSTSSPVRDRKSTRLNSSHGYISYAVFCLKKKNNAHDITNIYTTTVLESTVAAGIATVFVVGSTGPVTTLEIAPTTIAALDASSLDVTPPA